VVEFAEARNRRKLRQPYLDSLDLGWARPFVREVLYVEDNDDGADTLMSTLVRKKSARGKVGARSTIEVYESAFATSCIRQGGDLLVAVRDHEGKHAQLMYEYPELFAKEMGRRMRRIRKVIGELICHSFAFQQHLAGNVDISQKHVRFLLRHMEHYRRAFDRLLAKPKYRELIRSPLVGRMIQQYWPIRRGLDFGEE
jgi:hypothetical protein